MALARARLACGCGAVGRRAPRRHGIQRWRRPGRARPAALAQRIRVLSQAPLPALRRAGARFRGVDGPGHQAVASSPPPRGGPQPRHDSRDVRPEGKATLRVLWVDSQPPLPLDGGGRLRAYHLAREASRHSELGFLTFDTQPTTSRDPVSRKALLEVMPDLAWAELVRTPRVPKRLAQAVTTAGGPSWSLTTHRSRHMREAIRRAVLAFNPSVVHFNDFFLAPYRPCVGSDAAVVVAPHNVESLAFRRMAETASGDAATLALSAGSDRDGPQGTSAPDWV